MQSIKSALFDPGKHDPDVIANCRDKKLENIAMLFLSAIVILAFIFTTFPSQIINWLLVQGY